MKQVVRSVEYYYPVLLFVCMCAIFSSRGSEDLALDSIGRNALWWPLVMLAAALVGIGMSAAVSRRYGGASLMAASGRIGPAFLASVSYLLYAVLFWGGTLYMTLNASDFFSSTLLYGDQFPLTLLGVAVVFVAALFPAEAMGRYAHLIFLFVFPLLLIVVGLEARNVTWSYLYPVFDWAQLKNPLSAAAGSALPYTPLCALTLLLKPDHKGNPLLWLALLTGVSALYSIYLFAAAIGTFSIEAATRFNFVSYASLSAVRVENFVLERFVYAGIITWSYLQVVSTAFMFRCCALCVARAFGARLRIYHFIGIAVSIPAFALLTNFTFVMEPLTVALGGGTLFGLLVYPGLLYALAGFRKKVKG